MSLDEQIAAHVSEMKADGSWRQMETYAALRARSGYNELAIDLSLEDIEGIPVGLWEFLRDTNGGPSGIAVSLQVIGGNIRVRLESPYLMHQYVHGFANVEAVASDNMTETLESLLHAVQNGTTSSSGSSISTSTSSEPTEEEEREWVN